MKSFNLKKSTVKATENLFKKPFLNKLTVKMAKWSAKNPSNFILITSTLVWAVSSVLELVSFASSSKIPPKDKSFILKQEAATDVINLVLNLSLGSLFINIGEGIVKNRLLLKIPDKFKNIDVLKKIKGINPESLNKITPANKKSINNLLVDEFTRGNKNLTNEVFPKKIPSWIAKFAPFKESIGIIAGLTGSILAFQVLNPIIGNKIAAYFSNKKINTQNSLRTLSYTNVLNTNAFGGQSLKKNSINLSKPTYNNSLYKNFQIF